MIQKLIKKQWLKIMVGLLLPSIAALWAQHISAGMGEEIVQQTTLGAEVATLILVMVSGFAGYFLAQVLWGAGKWLMDYTATSLECDIRKAVFNKMLRAEYYIFKDKKPEELYINFNRDIAYVLSMFTTDLYNIVFAIIMGSGIFVLIMVRNFVVAVFVAILIVAVIVINACYIDRYKAMEQKERTYKEDGIRNISQMLSAKAIIRILNLQDVCKEEYGKSNQSYFAVKQEQNRLGMHKSMKMDWLVYSCATMILPISCLLVAMGKMELTDVIYITQLTSSVIWSTSNLGTAWIRFNQNKIALNSLEELLQTQEDVVREIECDGMEECAVREMECDEIEECAVRETECDRIVKTVAEETEADRIEASGDTALTFENVTIQYKDFTPVKNLNFACKKGSITAIVGRSGAGKSSIINAILGFADYTGTIKVWDKIATRQNRRAVRASIAYMSEFCEMDDMDLKEAVVFGQEKIAEEELWLHAEKLGIDKIENASVASGGEKQRIAFLRAYMKACDIYLLDEPTAALDERNEGLLLHYIKELKAQGKTVVLITHRQRTREIADQVVALA